LNGSETASSQSHHEDDAVRHLIELGYVDPDAVATREADLRRQLEGELQQAAQRLSKGEVEDAQRLLEQLASDDPEWIAPRQLLAETYYRTSRFADARTQLDWLAEHGVEQPRLALISGAIALARREFAAALDELEYACHVEPGLPSVYTLLGTTLMRLGSLDGAEDAFHNALRHNAEDAVAYDALAAIHLRRAQFEEAANFALESLGRNMRLFTAHYHLGVALAQLGRLEEAMVALETSTKMDTNRAVPYYWLSRIARDQLGDPDRATRYRNAGRQVIRRRRAKGKSI
jgi:predicted Zn-dependent protease